MELVELTEFLVKSVAIKNEEVIVKLLDETEDTIVITVLVDPTDIGRVVGKSGRTANSIRTIVQASSYLKQNKLVRISIDNF